MSTFGAFFKKKRIATGMTLRLFCREHGLDPGNISKIERDVNAPPLSRLDEYAGYLELEGDDLVMFRDLAHISARKIPEELSDEKLASVLPVFFRTARNEELSDEDLAQLVERIKAAWTPDQK